MSEPVDLTEAIKAAYDWLADDRGSTTTRIWPAPRQAVEAAAPVIERAVRDRVAAEERERIYQLVKVVAESYLDSDRDIIASVPFLATLNQYAFEDGVDLYPEDDE
jgi:hypothetical protein